MRLIYMPGDTITVKHTTYVTTEGYPKPEIRLYKGERYKVTKVDVGRDGTILYGLEGKEHSAYFESNFEEPSFLDEKLFTIGED